jgi:hypothetical protein
VVAEASGHAVASLLKATPLEWRTREESARQQQLAACQGSDLLVSLFRPPGSGAVQVAGLCQVL